MKTEAFHGFQAYSLNPAILSALKRAAYFQPTPIQAALIPEALKGNDVIGQAQTGTGKTAAFLIPFFNSWGKEDGPAPRALVLAPTRELVMQVTAEACKLAPSKLCRPLAIYGGQPVREQLTALKLGCSLVVGTPGRILDHLGRGTLKLDQVRYVVLDEADRMLDIGFRPDIEKILRRCPRERQTHLLSATVPPQVLRLSQRYMQEPVHINLSPDRLTVESTRQFFITVDPERKFELLLQIMDRENPRQCIIFCERKRGADQLFRHLGKEKHRVAAIHGDLPQSQRTQIMKRFREGSIVFLVATDVVSRGIDVTGISHIINYDLPEDPESYVHRIGRTSRMGADGMAIAFVTPQQGKQLTAIESFTNQEIQEDRVNGFQAFETRTAPEETPKTVVPVFGNKIRKYSRRL